MISDDLTKIFSKRPVSKSPSSDSDRSNKEENFMIYPGLENVDDDEDTMLASSFEINYAQDTPFYRFRTNTAARLEKLSDIRRKQAQTKTVKVDDMMIKFNQEENDDSELFIRKDLNELTLEPKTSVLSYQIEHLPSVPINKFQKYSSFDGSSHMPNETRSYQVFNTALPADLRDYPIKFCVQANAKVEEFIGFILYRCTMDYPQYANFEDVKEYGLYISDETGEPDIDFPPLDVNEQIQRFQFAYLALAKRIKSQFENRTLSDSTVQPIMRQISLDANKSFSINEDRQRTDEKAMIFHDTMVEAPIYKAYHVILISKKHFRSEVQLGISGDKIEIDPLQQKNTSYFFKQKAVHYSMDSVAWCEITSRKSSRFEFRIAYNPMFFDNTSMSRPSSQTSPSSWTSGPSTSLIEPTTPTSYTLKIQTFDSDPRTAEEIVMKVNNILQLRTSSVRREFLNRQEKTKKSFMRKKKFPI